MQFHPKMVLPGNEQVLDPATAGAASRSICDIHAKTAVQPLTDGPKIGQQHGFLAHK